MNYVRICWIIVVLIHISWNVIGQDKLYKNGLNLETSYIANESRLKQRNFKKDPGLNYPTSVERFYKENGYQLQWVSQGHHNPQMVPAMMLLDCVQQFGLDQEDFHPDEINYEKLEVLKVNNELLTEKERELFDVKLTDALITFMNYLHYGKFNINYSSIKTDWDSDSEFNAVNNLHVFLKSKDFFTAMTSVQPVLKEYDDLQKYMRLVRGQYMEDNYDFPEEKVQKMAINMERLRWLSTSIGNSNHIMVNIPSKSLKLYTTDSIYNFEAVIGSVYYPTPTLESRIKHFAIAPTPKVSPQLFSSKILPQALKNLAYLRLNRYKIYNISGIPVQLSHNKLLEVQKNPTKYFSVKNDQRTQSLRKITIYFNNTSVVDLHDVASLKVSTKVENTASDFGIGVMNLQELSILLLEQDGSGQKVPRLRKAFESYNLMDFKLNQPMPIAVTYVTCEIVDGQLAIYKDVYNQDQNLINRMYHSPVMTIAELKRK